jgi:uridine phosphorylase
MEYRIKINKWPKFKAPKSVILCYDNRILNYIEKNHDLLKYRAFGGDFWFLKETNNNVAVFGNFGLGSPMVATRMEELIQFGIKKFISIGEAGSLQKDLKIGEIVVCNKALRDEGVSSHYLKYSKYAYAFKPLVNKITFSLQKQNISFKVGSTWTMDAIYRQTKVEIKKYQSENILTVEMELATMFAIAQYRKVEVGAILTISDSLADLKWNPKFHETNKSLERIFEIAKNALSN